MSSICKLVREFYSVPKVYQSFEYYKSGTCSIDDAIQHVKTNIRETAPSRVRQEYPVFWSRVLCYGVPATAAGGIGVASLSFPEKMREISENFQNTYSVLGLMVGIVPLAVVAVFVWKRYYNNVQYQKQQRNERLQEINALLNEPDKVWEKEFDKICWHLGVEAPNPSCTATPAKGRQ